MMRRDFPVGPDKKGPRIAGSIMFAFNVASTKARPVDVDQDRIDVYAPLNLVRVPVEAKTVEVWGS